MPVPVDAHGLDVDALTRLTETTRVRAVYLTPHHQYPTTVTLSAGRRLALLDLARRRDIAIIEDDYAHEFHYDGRPVLPLASADREGFVIYIGTLAKILAPGLRIGYMVGPADLLKRAAVERFCLDIQGDHVLEHAVAELFEDGEVMRHARRARRIYEGRRDFMVELLRKRLGGALSVTTPPGGIALWANVAPDVSAAAWAARALELGVFVVAGAHFSFSRSPLPNWRLGFAAYDERGLGEAVEILAQALRDVRRGTGRMRASI